MEIPDRLQSLFSAELKDDGRRVFIEIPKCELEAGALNPGDVYRVALLGGDQNDSSAGVDLSANVRENGAAPSPPVEEGESRTVTIESIGDQGDGVAKVERGFVVIVPDGQIGDEVTVQITSVNESVAFGEIQMWH